MSVVYLFPSPSQFFIIATTIRCRHLSCCCCMYPVKQFKVDQWADEAKEYRKIKIIKTSHNNSLVCFCFVVALFTLNCISTLCIHVLWFYNASDHVQNPKECFQIQKPRQYTSFIVSLYSFKCIILLMLNLSDTALFWLKIN